MFVLRKITATLILGILLLAEAGATSPPAIDLAQRALDKLWIASGQFNIDKPILALAPDNNRVAAFSPSKNLITIDQKALDICMEMGNQAENAIAFLIGHELAHAFQADVRKHGEKTHFLAYSGHIHHNERTEKVADIQGVFTGYLAGYGMEDAIPEALKKIYKAYDLEGKILDGYPDFEDRSATAREVIALTRDLISLYEVNQYALAMKDYETASISLEKVMEYYQGYEVQNNLGVTYLKQAFSFYDPNIDRFLFPIRLYASTELEQIDARGPLPESERMFRNSIIRSALDQFEKSIERNKDFTVAKINKACAFIMLEKPEEAKAYLDGNAFSLKEKYKDDYLLVYGIALALLNKERDAIKMFKKIASDGKDPVARAYGNFNLNKLVDMEHAVLQKKELSVPPAIYRVIDGLKWGSPRSWPSMELNEGMNFKSKTSSSVKSFFFGDDFSSLFRIAIAYDGIPDINIFPKGFDLSRLLYSNIVVTDESIFVLIPDDQAIVQCDLKGKVMEVGRYF